MASPTKIRYNERAWAIDVISTINSYTSKHRRAIIRAGGEHTLSNASGQLFPDVLLFGDSSGTLVQQGWELKMPDTPITDSELLANAEKKARRLRLNSFVVWNANDAALYLLDIDLDAFFIIKQWPSLGLTDREAVFVNQTSWSKRIGEMLADINDLLESGSVAGTSPSLLLSDELFIEMIKGYVPALTQELSRVYAKSAIFAAEADEWWVLNNFENAESSLTATLARVNLINWLNRFLFAHYLKRFNSGALPVLQIGKSTSIEDALVIFESITQKCDFMNVFRSTPGQKNLDPLTWEALVAFNLLLVELDLDTIPQEAFQNVLDGALTYARQKLAGQFSTPKPLADLLVRIAVEDRTLNVIDPCCGTGTIAKAAYDLKKSVGLTVEESLATTWGSDKFAFPLQLCSIALSDPLGMGEIVRVFQHDAFLLSVGKQVTFTDPHIQREVLQDLPKMHAVVSNLPFVRFETYAKMNPQAAMVSATSLVDGLSGKSDLYAHLIFHLDTLLDINGRLGLVISNSWLGTEWGKSFRKALSERFHILFVVTSANGRWFSNADVVTNLLVLEKISIPPDSRPKPVVSFVSTSEKFSDWHNLPGGVSGIARTITLRKSSVYAAVHNYDLPTIQNFENQGLGWSALFSDLSWFPSMSPSLVPVNRLFDINRGERRGWDPLFYPEAGHGIEPEFISSVLKSSRNIKGLLAHPDGEAFCCSVEKNTLVSTGKSGVLHWINRFEHASNGTGKPLIQVLAKANHLWYEMKPNTLADFVVSMNPDKRIAVHRIPNKAFVNQRLIRFTAKGSAVDLDLAHALLNSTLGLYLLEAAGFGRGLAVLDLNASKLAASLHMLDISIVDPVSRIAILQAFTPLLKRNILDIPEELAAADRNMFDQTVLKVYGLTSKQSNLYAAMSQLYTLRQSARV